MTEQSSDMLSKSDKFRIGSVRAEERIETRLFWVRILYFRDISHPSPYAQYNDPLHALSILDNHLLVSGDVPRRLVFFVFVNINDPRTYGCDILGQRNGMVGHDNLEKLLHISLLYQTNALPPLYATASPIR